MGQLSKSFSQLKFLLESMEVQTLSRLALLTGNCRVHWVTVVCSRRPLVRCVGDSPGLPIEEMELALLKSTVRCSNCPFSLAWNSGAILVKVVGSRSEKSLKFELESTEV